MNGAEIADFKIQDYLIEMTTVNIKLGKLEDAERNLNEAEKIMKKMPPTHQDYKEREDGIKKMKENLNITKKRTGAAATEDKKKLQTRHVP